MKIAVLARGVLREAVKRPRHRIVSLLGHFSAHLRSNTMPSDSRRHASDSSTTHSDVKIDKNVGS